MTVHMTYGAPISQNRRRQNGRTDNRSRWRYVNTNALRAKNASRVKCSSISAPPAGTLSGELMVATVWTAMTQVNVSTRTRSIARTWLGLLGCGRVTLETPRDAGPWRRLTPAAGGGAPCPWPSGVAPGQSGTPPGVWPGSVAARTEAAGGPRAQLAAGDPARRPGGSMPRARLRARRAGILQRPLRLPPPHRAGSL